MFDLIQHVNSSFLTFIIESQCAQLSKLTMRSSKHYHTKQLFLTLHSQYIYRDAIIAIEVNYYHKIRTALLWLLR